MNLTADPWIPALRADGRRELFSLCGLFAEAHKLRDLASKPHERIALMRLLQCITQAALDGPEDEDAWKDCKRLIQPKVHYYLRKWHESFNLYGGGTRFLQVPNLEPGKESDEGNPASKLDLTLSTGNNATLFDNFAGESRMLQAARSCTNLLTFQCFAPGGRIGVAKWNGKSTAGKGSSNHAPCTPSSMIHGLVLGETLLESLHLNLLTKEAVTDSFGSDRWGMPIWEYSVEKAEDTRRIRNATMTYLGRLTPLSRCIRMHDGGLCITLANGLEYPVYPAFREATATIIKRKEELAVLSASTDRSLWRQLSAITVRRRTDSERTAGPMALSHDVGGQSVSLWIGALVTDKAKIVDVVESIYSLPTEMFSQFGRAAYEKGVAHAEEREGVLIQAVKVYSASLKITSPPYNKARRQFWTSVEQHLDYLFDLARNTALIGDLPNSDWGKAVNGAAFDAIENSCPHQTPRQIQAYALSLRKLVYRQKKQLSKT